MWKRIVLFLGLFFLFVINPVMIYSQDPPNYWRLVTNHIENPVVSAGPDLILASGQTQVQPQATINDATASILWNGPENFSSNVLRPWVSDLGTYEITATNSFGCSSSDQMELREAQLGDTLTYQLPAFCLGEDPVWLDEYISYSTEGSFFGQDVVGRYFYPNTAGIHNIYWVMEGDTIPFQPVYVLESPTVNIPNDSIFRCEGQNGILYAQGNATNWIWSTLTSPDDVLSTDQVYSVSVNQPMYYLLTGALVYETEQKTCSAKDSVFVSPISAKFTYEQMVIDTTYGTIYGSYVKFIPDYKDGNSYFWNLGISGVTSTEVYPDYNYGAPVGTVIVTLSMSSMCGNHSHTENIYINYVTGIDNLIKDDDVKLYPNPVSGDVVNLDFGDKRVSRVEVWDMIGRQLHVDQYHHTEFIFQTQIDVSSYRPGFYIVRVFGKEGGIIPIKFIKQ
ncbi:MAG: T9SS type A sorting domain-containing protein [Candidatus Absconditabacteria bacterium]|nr:T9SS type A sorting domain-containing protein [Candidatus Absconditabacteria bacterium]